MTFNKIQAYAIGLLLTTAPFWSTRAWWVAHSKKVTGQVVYVIRAGSQRYPLIQYEAQGFVTRVYGDYNLPYGRGDDIPIRYQPSDLQDTHYDSFWGLWLEPIIWCSIFFLLWTISFLIPDIVPKNALFQVKRFRIRMIKEEGESPV